MKHSWLYAVGLIAFCACASSQQQKSSNQGEQLNSEDLNYNENNSNEEYSYQENMTASKNANSGNNYAENEYLDTTAENSVEVNSAPDDYVAPVNNTMVSNSYGNTPNVTNSNAPMNYPQNQQPVNNVQTANVQPVQNNMQPQPATPQTMHLGSIDGNVPDNIRPSEPELRYYMPRYDLMPSKSMLWWVGFDFVPDSQEVKIEIMTRGAPRYDILQEKNQQSQPELVVRFYDTGIRKKVRRDIDTSEFKSPIAFIRTRAKEDLDATDVIITFRDPVKPKLFAKNGDLLFTFSIPEKYLNQHSDESIPESTAEVLSAADFSPSLIKGSQIPRSQVGMAGFPDPAEGAFANKQEVQNAAQEVNYTNQANVTGSPVKLETQNVPSGEGYNTNYSTNMTQPQSAPVQAAPQQVAPVQSAPVVQPPVAVAPPPVAEPYNSGDGFPAEGIENSPNSEPNDLEENIDNFEDGEYDDSEKFEVRNKFDIQIVGIRFVAQDDGGDFDAYAEEEGFNNVENGALNQSTNNSYNANTNLGTANVQPASNNAASSNSYSGNVANSPNIAPAPVDNAYANPAPVNNAYANPAPVNNAYANPAPANNGYAESPQVQNPASPEVEGQDNATAAAPSPDYKPVELKFYGAKLKNVIEVLADENNVNFITPGDVGEEIVTLKFGQVSWDNALRAVLETHKLGLVQLQGNIYRIDKIERLKAEKEELISIQRQADILEPTKVRVFRLSYAQAKDIQALAKNLLASKDYDKRIRVDIEERTNSLIVEGTDIDIAKISALIQRIDMQTPQVQITSRIVEVLEANRNAFGIDWSGPLNYDQGRGLGFGNLVFPNNMISTFAVDTGAESLSNSGVNANFGSINNAFELDMKLRAAESRGVSKILQNPTVVVEDNTKAVISAGKQDFVPVVGRDGEKELRTIDYLLNLEVTPHITIDGAVRMEIKIENASPIAGIAAESAGARAQRMLETSLLQENGETKAIGGLYTTESKHEVSGIPFLSKIPIIGALFRSSVKTDERRELILLLTPNILNGKKSTASMSTSSSVASEYESSNMSPATSSFESTSSTTTTSNANIQPAANATSSNGGNYYENQSNGAANNTGNYNNSNSTRSSNQQENYPEQQQEGY